MHFNFIRYMSYFNYQQLLLPNVLTLNYYENNKKTAIRRFERKDTLWITI